MTKPEDRIMPHQVMLNSLLSHGFAAVATFTVIAFPTPTDLFDQVFGAAEKPSLVQPSGLERTAIFDPEPVPDSVSAGLTVCASNMAGSPKLRESECGEVLRAAALLDDETALSPNMDEKRRLVAALYCRDLWGLAMGKGETFDFERCVAENQ